MENSHEFGKNFFQNIMTNWIEPEIEQRRINGRLPTDFQFKAAQIVFSPQGKVDVRLNQEVRGSFLATVSGPKNRGENVLASEIVEVKKFILDGLDENCAHITMIPGQNGWVTYYDFTYYKAIIKDYLDAADEFLQSAENCLNDKRLRPFFDNAYSCCELLATASLIGHLFVSPTNKQHDTKIEKFDKWAELGNTKKEYAQLLKRLKGLRPSSRYLTSSEYLHEDAATILKTLKGMAREFNDLLNN